MRVQIKNLGVIKEADFEVGDLTIICGDNNTGKTYVSYALFGFLDYWWNVASIQFAFDDKETEAKFSADDNSLFSLYLHRKEEVLACATSEYRTYLPAIFAETERLHDCTFNIDASNDKCCERMVRMNIQRNVDGALDIPDIEELKKDTLIKLMEAFEQVTKKKANFRFRDTPICESPSETNIMSTVKSSFSDFLPNPFIVTAERSGILNLWGELDVPGDPWNSIVNRNGHREKGETTVPLPVRRNIDFVRNVKNGRFRTQSPLLHGHPKFLDGLDRLFGGTFDVHENIPYFVPENSDETQLRMQECSSSVRSLFLIYYYLRFIAQECDILMIDEPELNLHPEKQRLMARLLARLVNAGIKVFLTTHSDYLIRELNILIMLNRKEKRFEKIVKEEKYRKNEFLDSEKVRVYTAEKVKKGKGYMLYPANIDAERGIEVKTFDRTIERTNAILEEIVYG